MEINSYTDQPTSKRQETVYLRSYSRNIPSHQLQPYLDARPVSTKYSFLPIIDSRKLTETPLIQQGTFNTEKTYNPGYRGPWSGYASNVNHESELRNQNYALQSCSQSVYVPSSGSNLYQINWENTNKPNQPFPGLFKNEKFCPVNRNPNEDKVGYALFNNATRQQTKDLTKETKCK